MAYRHRDGCAQMVTTLPDIDNKYIQFKNSLNDLEVPFVVYADFECLLQKVSHKISDKTINEQKHIPCSFSYYIKCNYNDSYYSNVRIDR